MRTVISWSGGRDSALALAECLAAPDVDVVELLTTVDPCGENGEFHTFVHDGPYFAGTVPLEAGETVTRELGDGTDHYLDLREPND